MQIRQYLIELQCGPDTGSATLLFDMCAMEISNFTIPTSDKLDNEDSYELVGWLVVAPTMKSVGRKQMAGPRYCLLETMEVDNTQIRKVQESA